MPAAATLTARARNAVCYETHWRGILRDLAESVRTGHEAPLLLGRWITSGPAHGAACGPAGYYVIAVALRATAPLRLTSNDRTLHAGPLERGMVQVSTPATLAEYHADAPCDFLHIYLSHEYLAHGADRELAGKIATAQSGGYPFMRDGIVRQLTHVLANALDSIDPTERACIDHVARALAARALEVALLPACARPPEAGKPPPLDSWRIRRTIAFIDDHLDQPVALAHLANAAGLSPTYFATRFRAATGISPRLFLVQRRLARAKVLLETTRMSMLDIALQVGFRTQSHFTTVFGRHESATPNQWRARHGQPDQRAAGHAAAPHETTTGVRATLNATRLAGAPRRRLPSGVGFPASADT
ncbi:AraC family transcriptional regulator [Paraburkholderia jirisanensis]